MSDHCSDFTREFLAQEIREGLRKRGFWAPETNSDLISAVFLALDGRESKYIAHEPGNGTRYEVFASRVTSERWVISSPEFHLSMHVLENAGLDPEYVIEKAGTNKFGRELGETDALELARAISKIIPGVEAP